MADWVLAVLENSKDYFLSKDFFFAPIYLLSAVLIAYVIWFVRERHTSFLRFILPIDLYRHASTKVDIKVSIFNMLFFSTGALSALYLAPVVTYELIQWMATLFGVPQVETTLLRGLLVAALLFLTQDFCRFITHYMHHKNPVLWPFHAVHHSAEVLTPLTFYRGHPVYYTLQVLIMSMLVGILQAIVLFLVVGQIEFWMIFASTLVFRTYVFLGAHLRHSHIRLSYGRRLEHFLISPAQHQVHHSSDPKHHDKNFGEVFAFWDWMFGSLYIADGDEDLIFGISDGEGNRIEQPHPSLATALLLPFKESFGAIAHMWERDPPEPSDMPASHAER